MRSMFILSSKQISIAPRSLMPYQLKSQFKQFPPKTPVSIVSSSQGTAQVKINNQQFLIPNSLLVRVSNPEANKKQRLHNLELQNQIAHSKPPLKAYEATTLINIQCRCGALKDKIQWGLPFYKERDAINNLIKSCTKCSPTTQKEY